MYLVFEFLPTLGSLYKMTLHTNLKRRGNKEWIQKTSAATAHHSLPALELDEEAN
jgi:hypothetical protein